MIIEIDQEEIHWNDAPLILTGKIDGKPWKAHFVWEKWLVWQDSGIGISLAKTEAIQKYLRLFYTPAFATRAQIKKTKIHHRRAILIGLGTFLIVFAAFTLIILKKRHRTK